MRLPSKGQRTVEYNVIDADGHVCEPGDLWLQYLPAEYRDRAPRIAVHPDDGFESFQYEDVRIASRPLGLRTIGALGMNLEDIETYADGVRGGFDPHARIEALEVDGIDAVCLFPSLGLLTGGIKEPDLAVEVCRAYNRWLADYCSPYPERLFGVAMLPMQSIEGAIEEVKFAREQLGYRAAFLRPNPYNGLRLSNAAYDRLWAVAQDLDVAISIHEGTGGGGAPDVGKDRVDGFAARHMVSHTFEQMLASMTIIWDGVCERFPRLRFGFMEAGGGWMAPWLDRMDRHFDNPDMRDSDPSVLTMRPSEYFERQCWVSFEPIERSIAYMAESLGRNKVLWATDYPHFDGWFPGAPKMIADRLPPELQRSVLAEGAMEFYKIGTS